MRMQLIIIAWAFASSRTRLKIWGKFQHKQMEQSTTTGRTRKYRKAMQSFGGRTNKYYLS